MRRIVIRMILLCMLLPAIFLSAGCGSAGGESAGGEISGTAPENGAASSGHGAGSAESSGHGAVGAAFSGHGAAGEIPEASEEVFAMDTYMTITCYGERAQEAADAAVSEIRRLDALLSVGEAESEISRINSEKEGTISSDTAAILEEALRIWQDTGGAFDITVYPLMEAWGFTSGEFRVPDEEELTDLLAAAGSGRISTDPAGGTVRIGEDQGIDLGGIAKGYASDRLMEIFRGYGLTGGVVSLGGNVECFGTKPDGSLWRCGIQSPLERGELMGILEIPDGAVITSGAYERFFTDEQTGKTYHHILDPSTGYPAETGLLSVTVVSPDGMMADALSTACYVMGAEKAIAFWRDYDRPFDLIIMTEDEEILVTEGIADRFDSSYPVTIVKDAG